MFFCCVGALAIMGSLHRIDKTFLGGGYVSSKLILETFLTKQKLNLAALMAVQKKFMISGTHGGFFLVWSSLTEFIGLDIENGGISDRPDDTVDVYHTYFAVAGFSLLQYPGVKAIDPAYALPVDVVNRITLGK
ncbi:geranylgeranyl transferase type-2 subunit beta 1-like isoform X2 [Malus domestica]|uniref:geranylgeranyl transferase type-2 subunit beta 1-like isoform X2 n=1 Tax=Malus domestica TaxID=3750 RepID=UPI0039757575